MAWLVAAWVALWGEPSAANLLTGVLVAGGLILAFPAFPAPGGARRGRLHPLAAARFAASFLWDLVVATAVVAREVVTPGSRISEGIVAVPIRGVSDLVTTVVANAISLTPGTLTVEVDRDPTVLYVHVLHLRDATAVRRDVRALEARAIRAFGGDEVVARLEEEERSWAR
jgi:multicomponent Na+:H+ antiporter subunit E